MVPEAAARARPTIDVPWSVTAIQASIGVSNAMRFSSMITAVDAHACGEPGRVITGGVLNVPGHTMFEKMTHLRDRADDLRLRMLREPRGYPAANSSDHRGIPQCAQRSPSPFSLIGYLDA